MLFSRTDPNLHAQVVPVGAPANNVETVADNQQVPAGVETPASVVTAQHCPAVVHTEFAVHTLPSVVVGVVDILTKI